MAAKGITAAEFARARGVARSTVTRWGQAGRLVLAADGGIDAEASVRRIVETSANRSDVADRHAANRASAGHGHAPPAENAPEGQDRSASRTRAAAQARKDNLNADILEIDLAIKRGTVIARDDVEAALKAIGAGLRSLLDVLPDQTAPLVAPVASLDECHQILADACRSVLERLGEAVTRESKRLMPEAAAS